MKFRHQVTLFSLILVSIFSPLARAYTIVIDPGHGGSDFGASQGTVIESRIALQVAQRFAAKFSEDSDVKIIMTRSKDMAVSLKDRTKSAEDNQADLFISLHGNSSTDRRARGAEFYFGSTVRPTATIKNSETLQNIISNLEYNGRLYQSQYLAFDTFSSWKRSNVTQARAIKQAPFFVINKNSTPAILVEIGFITNAKESIELLKEETQNQIAENLYNAVKKFRTNKL